MFDQLHWLFIAWIQLKILTLIGNPLYNPSIQSPDCILGLYRYLVPRSQDTWDLGARSQVFTWHYPPAINLIHLL